MFRKLVKTDELAIEDQTFPVRYFEARTQRGTRRYSAEILLGPSRVPDGTMNLFGALRRAMATTGYSELKEFQRVEVTVTPTKSR